MVYRLIYVIILQLYHGIELINGQQQQQQRAPIRCDVSWAASASSELYSSIHSLGYALSRKILMLCN